VADTSQGRRQAPVDYATGGPPAVTGWSGWVVFGGVMLMLMGGLHAIEGLVALFNKTYYVVTSGGLVVTANYTTWGWVHLVLGVVAILTGVGLLVGNLAARIVGVILAVISALVNMAFIAAYPLWSVILIALDVIVIYAIMVHGKELKNEPY
jgi:hypothetical protein